MANSTYLATVNRILQHAGQGTIADGTTFNTNASLEKVQLQAKMFVDKANRRLVRKNRARFLQRQYSLTTSSSSNSYSLTSGATSNPNVVAENIIEDSMFITTTSYGYGPIKYLDYHTWMASFPEGESVKGQPRRWICLPMTDTTSGGNYDAIAFSPPPDAAYTIKFEYYEDPVVLSSATDTIQWPTHWEDVLWDYGQLYLEICLSEGKAADLAKVMEGLDSEIRQLTMGAIEKPPCVDLGLDLTGLMPPRRGIVSDRSYP